MTESSKGEKGNIILKVIQKKGAEGWGGTTTGPRPHGKFGVDQIFRLQLTAWILCQLFIHPNTSVSPNTHQQRCG